MTSVINHLFDSVPGSLLWVHGFVAQEVARLNPFTVYALKYFQKKRPQIIPCDTFLRKMSGRRHMSKNPGESDQQRRQTILT